MSKRKAKRLYAGALRDYQAGYIKGTNALHADNAGCRRIPLFASWDPEDEPAYHAGYDAGFKGGQIDPSHLPLDVWVRVLAMAMRPRP